MYQKLVYRKDINARRKKVNNNVCTKILPEKKFEEYKFSSNFKWPKFNYYRRIKTEFLFEVIFIWSNSYLN